jgi:hypothetical protein
MADDFIVSNLRESKNEWCCYLVDILTPLVTQGIRSIFQQSYKLCLDKSETNKYLMTFQNLLSLVSKWNSVTIEEERKRIVEQSSCSYLDELIVCVHIIHLKVMTHIRVGNKQKKVDISLPKLDDFLHKVYIHAARRVYKNVYLFELGIDSLTQQKYNRELELIVQESILAAVRDSIPKEQIIRAFMDESVEQEEEVVIEAIAPAQEQRTDTELPPVTIEELDQKSPQEVVPSVVPTIENVDNNAPVTRLTFNDFDAVMDMGSNQVEDKYAPKTLENLERISAERALQRKQEEEDDDLLKITNETLSLSDLGIVDIGGNSNNELSNAIPPVAISAKDDLIPLLDIQEI